MSFGENLYQLRKGRNMTQEQLAMLLGVSRQAVSRWESETAYPEMDKLVRLCDIFGCSFDELIRGHVEDLPSSPELAVPLGTGSSDLCDYDKHIRGRARLLSSGVAACVLGFAGASLTGGSNFGALFTGASLCPPVSVLIAMGLVVGVAVIALAFIKDLAFMKNHPFVENFYTDKDRRNARRACQMGAAVLVGLLAVGIGGLGLWQSMWNVSLGVAWLLASVALGVWAFVFTRAYARRVDVACYNERAAMIEKRSCLSEDAKVCVLVMAIFSMIALSALLLFGHPLYWFVWVLGVLACAVVVIVRMLSRTTNKEL